MTRKYESGSIEVLSEMEGVRRHPGVYVGDIDANGTLQCFNEIIQNAVDETREVGGGRILVRVSGDVVLVADEGRGIPIEVHEKTGVSALETVLTRLHAGGKSGKGKTAYGDRTFGLHGVGLSAVCALSLHMSVWTFRRGCWWRLDTTCGK